MKIWENEELSFGGDMGTRRELEMRGGRWCSWFFFQLSDCSVRLRGS